VPALQEILEVTEVVGVVKVGLSPKAISALPVLRYSAARRKILLPAADSTSGAPDGTSGAAVDLEKCMVCLEEYEEDVDVTCLPCHHLYHPPCIEQWLTNKKVLRLRSVLFREGGVSQDGHEDTRSHRVSLQRKGGPVRLGLSKTLH
jgi:hypothetical protein